YLESFGNPRRFARLAPDVARRKPIVAVKSGRSAAGSRAASSHSASLACLDVAVDALFETAGGTRPHRGRAGHPAGRRLRGAGALAARADAGDARDAALVPAARGRAQEPDRHD